ncbi:hypothetical protein [Algoriphagus sp. Y33]|nr:hypothetical protein [Algoriphagus sp. Y33]
MAHKKRGHLAVSGEWAKHLGNKRETYSGRLKGMQVKKLSELS